VVGHIMTGPDRLPFFFGLVLRAGHALVDLRDGDRVHGFVGDGRLQCFQLVTKWPSRW